MKRTFAARTPAGSSARSRQRSSRLLHGPSARRFEREFVRFRREFLRFYSANCAIMERKVEKRPEGCLRGPEPGEASSTFMKEASRKLERRRVPRIVANFPVTVTWGRKQFRWEATECSEYGIFLAAPNKELVGEDVQLAMMLEPKKPLIGVTGVVAYATDTGLGVRFKNISPEHQMVLKEYVQARGIGIVRQ